MPKLRVKKTTQSMGNPGDGLSYQDINAWSDFADKNYRPGMKFDELWVSFQRANPNTKIDKNVLLSDINKLQAFNRDLAIRKGVNLPNIEDVNTGFSFPRAIIDGKDYGRVNARGMTENVQVLEDVPPVPISQLRGRIPQNVNPKSLEVIGGWPSWEEDGDIVFGNKNLLGTQAFKSLGTKKK